MKKAAPKPIVFYSPDRRKKVLVRSSWGSALVKVFLALIVINLAILNFILLRENFSFDKARDVATKSADMMVSESVATYEEVESLKRELEAKIATATARTTYLSPTTTNYTSAVPVSRDFEHKMEYVKFSGGHGTNSTTWWTASDMKAKFNIANFPNYTAWWEAHLRIKDGGGKAYARIFDADANIPIEGSEIETSSTSLVQVSSGPLKFYPGDTTYKIQIKSLLGPEAVVEDAKIKISWIEE